MQRLPPLGPDGQLLGVLDISTDAAHHGGDMLGTVRLLAMTLENALLARQPGWLVDLDPQSLWSARLLLGRGELLGANRAGRLWLGQHPSTVSSCCASAAACGWCRGGERAARPPERGLRRGSQAQQVPLKMLERASHCSSRGDRQRQGAPGAHPARQLEPSGQPTGVRQLRRLPAELVEAELFGYVGGPSAVPAARAARAICAPPTAASRCWMKLASCRSRPRPGCCGCCRSASSPRWAAQTRGGGFLAGQRQPSGSGGHGGGRHLREDLYYRICGWRQQLAPAGLVGARASGLILNLLAQMDPALQLSREAEQRLLAHPLPGNVRQLKQALEVACVLAEGRAGLNLPICICPPWRGERAHLWEGSTLREQSRQRVQQTLAEWAAT